MYRCVCYRNAVFRVEPSRVAVEKFGHVSSSLLITNILNIGVAFLAVDVTQSNICVAV